MTAPVLQLTDLTVHYDSNGPVQRDALHRVSFSLKHGDTLVILGPNGSGKSTLLHSIAGNLSAQVSGQIELSGFSILKEPGHRRAQRVAIVHQDPSRGTAAHLSLKEHCDLTATHPGRLAVTWQQVESHLGSLGTKLDPTQLAGELSGGQRQLFTLLLAVLSSPKLLLLDEPTSSLDTRHRALLIAVVQNFAQRKDSAMVLVTHDLAEAQLIGNRLLILSARGELVALLDANEKSNLSEVGLQDLLTRATSAVWTGGVATQDPTR
ncbi:MAG: ATP-binding cassette domain-containing protein [Candidatus Acidiferrales bacterium]